MDITFADRKLGQAIMDDRLLDRSYGKSRANKIRLRLAQLKAAETLGDLVHAPGKFHALRSNRRGQLACDLDHPYRLLFVPQQGARVLDRNGRVLWDQVTSVQIVGIIDYH